MKNKMAQAETLAALRARLEVLDGRAPTAARCTNMEAGDDPLAGLVSPADLHEIYAETTADAPSAGAFALALAARMAGGRMIVWSLQSMNDQESGRPFGPGLAELGIPPDDLLLVRVRDAADLLAVGEEALRHSGTGAVVLSAWGEGRAFSLTASRRLAMAARAGTTIFLVRMAAQPAPSAAESRWSLRSAPSTPLEAGAPGRPAFRATLTRHRKAVAPRTWNLEWDRERRSFVEPAPLSGGMAPLSADRTDQDLRRAG